MQLTGKGFLCERLPLAGRWCDEGREAGEERRIGVELQPGCGHGSVGRLLASVGPLGAAQHRVSLHSDRTTVRVSGIRQANFEHGSGRQAVQEAHLGAGAGERITDAASGSVRLRLLPLAHKEGLASGPGERSGRRQAVEVSPGGAEELEPVVRGARVT